MIVRRNDGRTIAADGLAEDFTDPDDGDVHIAHIHQVIGYQPVA